MKTTTTLLRRAGQSPHGEAASKALRDAGVGIVEIENWDEAADELRKCGAALVVCNGESLDAGAPKHGEPIPRHAGAHPA